MTELVMGRLISTKLGVR